MQDPHVEVLYYQVSSAKDISYVNPESIHFENGLGAFFLDDGKLRINPAEHFATQEEAIEAIGPFLLAWEIQADLQRNVGMLRFKFERAKIIDRNPPPPGSTQFIHAESVLSQLKIGTCFSAHLQVKSYPKPPTSFEATSQVQTAYRRYLQYRNGNETFLGMAYVVLTLAEGRFGNGKRDRRAFAADALKIDIQILKTIGSLVSERGGELTMRKACGSLQELSHIEKEWLDQAIKLIILRMAEISGGTLVKELTMDDLPTLPES